MTAHNEILEWASQNVELVAPVAVLLVAYVLYGLLGERYLGADDDFWPYIRGQILPRVDAVAREFGFYTSYTQDEREFVATVDAPLDTLERELYAAGYRRNPLAAYKTSPNGNKSSGSWAKRYGGLRKLGELIGKQGFTGPLGRFLAALGEVLALKQTHITLYEREDGVAVYAHAEYNSLNPVVAYQHYVGDSMNVPKGVRQAEQTLARRGLL